MNSQLMQVILLVSCFDVLILQLLPAEGITGNSQYVLIYSTVIFISLLQNSDAISKNLCGMPKQVFMSVSSILASINNVRGDIHTQLLRQIQVW